MPWRLSSEPLSLSIISHCHVARSYDITSGLLLLLPGPAWSHTLCSAQAVPFMVSCVFRLLSGAGLGPLPWRPLGCCPVSCQAHIPQEVGRGMGPWTESEMREPPGHLSSCCHDHWLGRRRSLIKSQQGQNHYSSPTLRLSCHVWLITSDLPFL